MMAGERVAAAAGVGVGPFDDVDRGTVVLEKIEVDGGEVAEGIAEIADDADGFKEDFGHDDGGADVEIDAAFVEAADHFAEEAEVVVRRFAYRGAICAGVSVGGVGTVPLSTSSSAPTPTPAAAATPSPAIMKS